MMLGYVTLDCRDGVHGACATCDCRCHRASMIICTDDDILRWPSCPNMDPPMEHSIIRWNGPRDRRGRFQRAYYGCERCDRAIGHMDHAPQGAPPIL